MGRFFSFWRYVLGPLGSFSGRSASWWSRRRKQSKRHAARFRHWTFRRLAFESFEARIFLSANSADFTGDTSVDRDDLVVWETRFGNPSATHRQGDADWDSDVDGSDFLAWQRQFGQTVVTVAVADFDGDGREDPVHFHSSSNTFAAILGAGGGMELELDPTGTWTDFQTGDFNGDGRDDLMMIDSSNSEWTVALSESRQFLVRLTGVGTHWLSNNIYVGDFDGDGSDEMIGRGTIGGAWQLLDFDERFGTTLQSDFGFSLTDPQFQDLIYVGDVNRDGRDDLLGKRSGSGWDVGITVPMSGNAFKQDPATNWGTWFDEYTQAGIPDADGPYREITEIFASVYNHMELELYPGLMKGPQATRETRSGNSWDQGALLVQELENAGFEADMVSGKVRVEAQQLQAWLGVKSAEAALNAVFIALDSGAQGFQIDQKLFVDFKHAWVRVKMPAETGLQWVDLDPSWKFKARQPGIEVQIPGERGTFDEFAYLADPDNQLPIEYYEDQVLEYLASAGLPGSLADVPHDGPIVQRRFTDQPLLANDHLVNATEVEVEGTFSDIVSMNAEALTHRVRVSIGSWSRDIVIPESSLSTFAVQRETDRFTFFVDGNPETPVALAAGSTPLILKHAKPGESLNGPLQEILFTFDSGGADGRLYTISLDANQHSQSELDRLRTALNEAAADGVTTADIDEVLAYVSARYWYDHNRFNRQIDGLMHAVGIDTQVSSGLVMADNGLLAEDFSHQQTPIVPRNVAVDFPNGQHSSFNINFDSSSGAELLHREAFQLSGYTASALEHAVLEETINSESISTLRGLTDAYLGDPAISTAALNSVWVIDSVVEGAFRKIYLRGEIGQRAAEGAWNDPYSPTRTDILLTSQSQLEARFPNQPSVAIANIWSGLTTNVAGTATAILPEELSYAGSDATHWEGSVYVLQKDLASPGGSVTAQFAIQAVGGPTMNGGYASNNYSPPNLATQVGANSIENSSIINFNGDPVNVLNGNMFRDELDIAMPNIGVPLTFVRRYNSQSEYDVGLGRGWVHSFSDRLLQESGVSDELIWLTSAGLRYTFTKNGALWESPTSLLGTLKEVSGGYAYFADDGIEHHFQSVAAMNATGEDSYVARLTKIVDRNGHGVQVNYMASSRFSISRVQDVESLSRRLDFTNPTGNHITVIEKQTTGQLNGTWTYQYNENGKQLLQVTNPEQELVKYDYYPAGSAQDVISRITEADGAYHEYEYYPNGRTFRVREGVFDGNEYIEQSSHSLSYNLFRNITEFTDENGNVETYLHQPDGQLIGQVHEDRTRTATEWGVPTTAGGTNDQDNDGIFDGTEFLQTELVDEIGALENFAYYLGETGPDAFKNQRLKSSTAKHFPGDTPRVTEYDYEQAGLNFAHIVNLSSIVVAPGSSAQRATSFQYNNKGQRAQRTDALNQITAYDYYPDNHATRTLRGLLQTETRPRSTAADGSGSGTSFDTVFAYDSAGFVTSAARDNLPAGNTLYDSTGSATLVVDATGVATSSTYDAVGRRLALTQLGDRSTSADDFVSLFVYDPRGRLLESTDALGRVTTWEYDRRGNVARQTHADGSEVRFQYDAVGNRIAATDALGRVTHFVYDHRNRLIQTLLPDGASERVRYDGLGRVVATTDALGRETHLVYDARGQLIKSVAAAGSSEEITTVNKYNLSGDLVESVDPEGNVTQFVHDKLGRVVLTRVLDLSDVSTSETLPTVPTQAPAYLETTDYDAQANVAETVVYDVAALAGQAATLRSDDPRSLITTHPEQVQVTKTYYDVTSRPTEVVWADDTRLRTQYDDAGRVRFQYDELNRVTELRHDDFGRLATTLLPDPDGSADPTQNGPIADLFYDAAGNIVASRDANGHTTYFRYDARNRLVASTDAVGAQSRIVYDLAGQVVASIDAHGMATAIRYDQRGRVVLESATDPDGSGPLVAPRSRTTYDAGGNLVSLVDPLGTETRFTYDHLNRIKTESTTISYSADNSAAHADDPAFDVVGSAAYQRTDGSAFGNDYTVVTNASAPAEATWRFSDLEGGTYRIGVAWDASTTLNAEQNATIQIKINGTVQAAVTGIDQQAAPRDFARDHQGRMLGWLDVTDGSELTIGQGALVEVVLIGSTSTPLLADAVLLERTDATLTYDYYENGTLKKLTDLAGRETNYTYDEMDRPVDTRHPDPDPTDNNLSRPTTRQIYDGYGNVTDAIEYRQGTSMIVRQDRFLYDQRNRLLREELDVVDQDHASENLVSLYLYDDVGNLVETRKAADSSTDRIITRFSYDDLNRLTEQTFIASPTLGSNDWSLKQQFEYDTVGNLSQQTEVVRDRITSGNPETQVATRFAYDDVNRLVTETRDAGGPLSSTTQTAYDLVGNTVSITDPTGRTTVNQYDALHRLIKSIGPDENISDNQPSTLIDTVGYDALGNLAFSQNAAGDTTNTIYDSLGRQIQVIDGRGKETRYQYDSLGNLASMTDANFNATTYGYDRLDRVITESIEDRTAGTLTRQHVYTDDGTLRRTTDRNGRVVNFSHDGLGRLILEQWFDPGVDFNNANFAAKTLTWRYDPLGRITRTRTYDGPATDPLSLVETFEYDNLDRVTTQRNWDPIAADAVGVPQVTLVFQYDLQSTDPNAFHETMVSQQTNSIVDFATTTYVTDRLGRLGRIVDVAAANGNAADDIDDKTIEFTYDPADRMTSVDRSSLGGTFLFDTQHGYDDAGRLASLVHSRAGSPVPFADYNTTYDSASRIKQVVAGTAFDALQLTRIDDTTYDASGQLDDYGSNLTDNLPGTRNLSPNDQADDFSYDDAGNREFTGGTIGDNNRVEDDGTHDYTYDNEGNTKTRTHSTTSEQTEYDWDHRNRLVEVIQKASVGATTPLWRIEYTYNNDNLRVRKQYYVGGATVASESENYVYDDGQLALVLDDDTEVRRRYLNGPGIDALLADEAFTSSGGQIETHWIAADHASSVRDVINTQNELVNHLEYNSFGEITDVWDENKQDVDLDALATDVAFAGRERDRDTGLYYNRARWYDAALGRFMSEDPIGFRDGPNQYRYAGNDPVNFRDPTGLSQAGNPLINLFSYPSWVSPSGIPSINDLVFDGSVSTYNPVNLALDTHYLNGLSLGTAGLVSANLPLFSDQLSANTQVSRVTSDLGRTYDVAQVNGRQVVFNPVSKVETGLQLQSLQGQNGGSYTAFVSPGEHLLIAENPSTGTQAAIAGVVFTGAGIVGAGVRGGWAAGATAFGREVVGETVQTGLEVGIRAGTGVNIPIPIGIPSKGSTGGGRGLSLKSPPLDGTGGVWKSLPGGIRIKKTGNYWIKQVDPNASSLAQSYARLGLGRQARDLNRLGNLAPSNIYKNGNLVVRDAGRFSGTKSQLQVIRLRAMVRLRTPFTDIHSGNVGANGIIFDPSLNPIAHATAVGGSIAFGTGIGFGIDYIRQEFFTGD